MRHGRIRRDARQAAHVGAGDWEEAVLNPWKNRWKGRFMADCFAETWRKEFLKRSAEMNEEFAGALARMEEHQ